jgi:hypothetical protein
VFSGVIGGFQCSLSGTELHQKMVLNELTIKERNFRKPEGKKKRKREKNV